MGIFADYEFLTATKLNTVFGNYALSADVSGMVSAAVATETTARTTAVSGEATARTSAIATAAAAIVNNTSAPSIAFAPQGNPASTLGSHVLQATTGSSTGREFLLSANLYSNTGSGAGPGVADKVAIYAATEGVANSGDIWSVNSLTSMDAGFPSSSYALGYELDFNNFAQDRGTTIGWQGFSGATATGLLVTGASTHWSTSAISVEGNNSTQWQRGVSVINAGQAAFFDWCNATAGLISYGNHTYGVDLNPMTLGFGGAAVRIANGHPISSRNAANTADVPLIYLNGSNNITLGGAGSSGIYVSVPNLVPATDGTASLGGASLRWLSVYLVNSPVVTSDPGDKNSIESLPSVKLLVKSLEPKAYRMNVGGVDTVEATETQLVHATAEHDVEVPHVEVVDGQAVEATKTVKQTVHLYDEHPVFDADGQPVMITVAAQDAVVKDGVEVRPAIPERTFQKTHRVPRMVEAEVPVTKDQPRAGKRFHLGFLATDVRDAFKAFGGKDWAVYKRGEGGSHHVVPDEMTPILWAGLQEAYDGIDALKEAHQEQAVMIRGLIAELTALKAGKS